MKNENSVLAAQKMTDLTLPIFPVEAKNCGFRWSITTSRIGCASRSGQQGTIKVPSNR